MSALIHIGAADHHLLNAATEIARLCAPLASAEREALISAGANLGHARAALGALRFVLRSHALAEVLEYHESMARTTREAAVLARHVPGRGLHIQANDHARRAAAIRVLIGPPSAEVCEQGDVSA
jgi:hypothetical protein